MKKHKAPGLSAVVIEMLQATGEIGVCCVFLFELTSRPKRCKDDLGLLSVVRNMNALTLCLRTNVCHLIFYNLKKLELEPVFIILPHAYLLTLPSMFEGSRNDVFSQLTSLLCL